MKTLEARLVHDNEFPLARLNTITMSLKSYILKVKG